MSLWGSGFLILLGASGGQASSGGQAFVSCAGCCASGVLLGDGWPCRGLDWGFFFSPKCGQMQEQAQAWARAAAASLQG